MERDVRGRLVARWRVDHLRLRCIRSRGRTRTLRGASRRHRSYEDYVERGRDDVVRPTWSPDSRTLLFVRRELDATAVDLWTVNADGSALFQVTHDAAEYSGYRWVPAG